MAAAEARLCIAGHGAADLSEQELLECVYKDQQAVRHVQGPAGGCSGGTPSDGWSYIASIGLTSETLRAYRNDDDPTQHGTCATETRAIFATCPAPQKVAPRAHTTISVLLFAVAMHQRRSLVYPR